MREHGDMIGKPRYKLVSHGTMLLVGEGERKGRKEGRTLPPQNLYLNEIFLLYCKLSMASNGHCRILHYLP